MATFPPPRPLPERIVHALGRLRQARLDGCATRIGYAQIRLDELLDQLPRT